MAECLKVLYGSGTSCQGCELGLGALRGMRVLSPISTLEKATKVLNDFICQGKLNRIQLLPYADKNGDFGKQIMFVDIS